MFKILELICTDNKVLDKNAELKTSFLISHPTH